MTSGMSSQPWEQQASCERLPQASALAEADTTAAFLPVVFPTAALVALHQTARHVPYVAPLHSNKGCWLGAYPEAVPDSPGSWSECPRTGDDDTDSTSNC
eukprot:5033922-Amphidinium_carterae.1